MLTEDKVLVLKEIEKTISIVLQKIDKENESYISVLELNKKQREILLKAMDDFEKRIQAFFIVQKKEYLAAVKKFSTYMKKGQGKIKHIIKKAEVSDKFIDDLVKIMSDFIFINEKAHIDKLVELYIAFSDSFFLQYAEICARSVEGSKLGSNISLSKRATDWLDKHKIKFAKEVNRTTHDAIIKSLRESLLNGKESTPAANKLMIDVPNHFNQKNINNKWKSLDKIIDTKTYNQIYQEIEKEQCFEFYRARRIARTETISAMNAATLEGWRQSEVVGGKEWICACDERAREWHKKADKQQVALEEVFLVGNEKLMHPGDSSLGASAKNVINCRCTMKSVLKYKIKR